MFWTYAHGVVSANMWLRDVWPQKDRRRYNLDSKLPMLVSRTLPLRYMSNWPGAEITLLDSPPSLQDEPRGTNAINTGKIAPHQEMRIWNRMHLSQILSIFVWSMVGYVCQRFQYFWVETIFSGDHEITNLYPSTKYIIKICLHEANFMNIVSTLWHMGVLNFRRHHFHQLCQ